MLSRFNVSCSKGLAVFHADTGKLVLVYLFIAVNAYENISPSLLQFLLVPPYLVKFYSSGDIAY